ncbi:MAG: 3-hydroxyacyl-CoA dehydrogenase family protein [Bacteroidia bacterium]|nr:3-hydroxyacyl-CoA dehydrogenase family protein [Bacteroidia bacterium]MCX7652024.1 3-hydroxyacyl-CoA dehydrogenase family protein [Bacteroidia bacterium]MDW8416305.1 3-hydroxyacyl-CoA dehydrogenase family protein [Bacteroidia bacterium]
MRTLVIGSQERIEALMRGVGQRWQPDLWVYPTRISPGWGYYDVIVDLEADERSSPAFSVPSRALWVLSAVKKPLRSLLPAPTWAQRCIGANLLPVFCERALIEACALSEEAWSAFQSWEPQAVRVPDSVGMVSPRLLALILNEALLLQGEAALTMETIDLAVKLGLNYPRTISEWGKAIGWHHILHLMEALQTDYGAGTYPIAPLLRSLANQTILSS